MDAAVQTKTKRVLHFSALSFFVTLYCVYAYRFSINPPSGQVLIWLIPLIYIIAALCADLVSGLVHFLGDHPIGDNKRLHQWFYASFQEHHLDPVQMTKHGPLETNGLNALGASMIVIPSFFYSLSSQNIFDFSVYLFILFFSLLIFLTNQIHKWAHTTHPPKIVKFLQTTRLILNPRNHIQHHIAHDKYYCITTGWLNYVCYKTQIWERLTGIKNRK